MNHSLRGEEPDPAEPSAPLESSSSTSLSPRTRRLTRKSAGETIKVFLRIKPNSTNLSTSKSFKGDPPGSPSGLKGSRTTDYSIDPPSFDQPACLHLRWARRFGNEAINNTREDYDFQFNSIFDMQSTQEEVFTLVGKDCVYSFLDGYNSTIFAYGQTGSGKTYTITGGANSYAERGLIPRAISLIFDEIQKRSSTTESTVRVSYLQIYNERGQDLLNRGNDARSLEDLPKVSLTESLENEFVLKGLESHTANSVQDALNLLFLGDTNRIYCETPMNQTSSRSHCIFTISLEARDRGSLTIRSSKLHIVDLAGSERVAKSQVDGNVLKEAKYINLSLHFLEQVIAALSARAEASSAKKSNAIHVPYRNSFMTMALRDSLGGNSRTVMIATCHMQESHVGETLSTCKFAQRVASIRQAAQVNEETDPKILIRRLKQEIVQLKEELAMYRSEDCSGSRILSSEEVELCRQIVHRYVDHGQKEGIDTNPSEGNPSDCELTGLSGDMARIRCVFRIFRDLVIHGGVAISSSRMPPDETEIRSELEERNRQLQVVLDQKELEIQTLIGILQKAREGRQSGVISSTSDAVGVTAPLGALPTVETENGSGSLTANTQNQPTLEPLKQPNVRGPSYQTGEMKRFTQRYNLTELNARVDILEDRTKAFEAFRSSYRKHEEIEKSKDELKGLYSRAKTLAANINASSDKLKSLKQHIVHLRAENALQGIHRDVVDPLEKELLSEMDGEKLKYRTAAQELARLKEQIDTMHLMMQKVQQEVVHDFDEWFRIRNKQVEFWRKTAPETAPERPYPPLPGDDATRCPLQVEASVPQFAAPGDETPISSPIHLTETASSQFYTLNSLFTRKRAPPPTTGTSMSAGSASAMDHPTRSVHGTPASARLISSSIILTDEFHDHSERRTQSVPSSAPSYCAAVHMNQPVTHTLPEMGQSTSPDVGEGTKSLRPGNAVLQQRVPMDLQQTDVQVELERIARARAELRRKFSLPSLSGQSKGV